MVVQLRIIEQVMQIKDICVYMDLVCNMIA